MFANNRNLTHVDLSGLNLTGVESLSCMFSDCNALVEVDNIQEMNTEDIVDMNCMFSGCSSLKSLSISTWNTKKVKNFSKMFADCTSIQSIDLSGWCINDADVHGMFYGCSNLSNVALYDVKIKNTIAANYMFDRNNCIQSYHFADMWDIDVDKYINPLAMAENYQTKIEIVYTTEKSAILKWIYYEKDMPLWYKNSVAIIEGVEDFYLIKRTKYEDLYVSTDEPLEITDNFTLKDIINSVIDSMKEVGALSDEDTVLYDKVEAISEILESMKEPTLGNVCELCLLSLDELEKLREN